MRRLAASIALSSLVACGSSTSTSSSPGGDAGDVGAPIDDAGASAHAGVELLAVIDLPRNASTQALSGTSFDPATRTLWAIGDREARFVPITVAEDYASVSVGAPLALTGRPDGAWDGEGIVRMSDGSFIAVTNETTPTIERFDATGAFVDAIAVPPELSEQAAGNKGLESLTASPDRTWLFTANEAALTIDGPVATKTKGTTIRILRRDLEGGADEEKRYTTEPLGAGGTSGDMGVSDLAALSERALLVLERGYQSGYGNTVRIFRVDFAEDAPVLTKSLVVDVGTLPSDGVTHPSTQPNPILDNYEALALGPDLGDGRVVLFVTSDDNESATQVARILVLAVPKT